jgi:glycerate 2-kinase
MRVLICPDKFAGTMSAVDAAAALADGWRDAAPADDVVVRPLADGGPGFLDVLSASLRGRRVAVPVRDPLGRPVEAEVLLVGDPATAPAAYLESAQACGLHLLAAGERDPRVTTSYGLGMLLAAAVEHGVREVVVGLGGSAVNDGGAGLLAALDAAPVDDAGYPLPYGAAPLVAVAGLAGTPRLRGASLVAATDVDSPLLGPDGATRVFAAQKGARPADLPVLEAALARFAEVLERELPTCPDGLAARPGGGAAGGLGAALLALGGRRESGIGLVRRLVGLDGALDAADLVITGEGAFDRQSLRGKVVAGVAAAARARGRPCLVVAGQVRLPPDEVAAAGFAGAYSLVEHVGDQERAMARPGEGLRSLGATLARTTAAVPGGKGRRGS